MFRRKSNPIIAAARSAVETLEDRKLMSVDIAVGNGTLFIDGSIGDDVIDVSFANGKYTVVGNGKATQVPAAGVSSILLEGWAGNDILRLSPTVNVPSEIIGESGNDTIRGGSNRDVIWGYEGNDTIDGGLGNDVINGGADIDTVDYSSRTTPVNVSLDNTVNDGAAGEGDVTYHIENIIGGSANDVLTGNDQVNIIYGRGGNDQIQGGNSNDTLYGEQGDDSLNGGAYHDTIYGGPGNDMLFGSTGNDKLFGEAGNDFLDGSVGADEFNGGTELDTAAYIGRAENLTITIDGIDNDGANNERDNVRIDVENVIGGNGNDRIIGSSAANQLFGSDGNDWISGLGGDDVIGGNAGDDRLFGGIGKDTLNGNLGNDVLVTIDSAADIANGNEGTDSFWVNSSDTTDATAAEKSNDRFHVVASYANYGASINPSGQDLSDPTIAGLEDKAREGTMSFGNNPLFATGTPKFTDVVQGKIGDCYFLSGLSGTAKTRPQLISESVVELGDGTFAVRYYDGSTPKYYRVDGELPLSLKSGAPAFAGIGGGLWVAIMEKAYVHHAGRNAYRNIAGGWGDEAFEALGKANDYWWTVAHSEAAMAAKIKDVLAKGGAVTAGTDPTDPDTKLVSTHSYTILSISGTTLTLRNPWGYDGRGGDSGAAGNDGLITMSMTEFDDSFATLYWSYL